jgi:serine protease Do
MSIQNYGASKRLLWVVSGLVMGVLISFGINQTGTTNALPQPESPQAQPSTASVKDINVARSLSNAYISVAEQVNASVVTVFTETVIKNRRSSFHNSPFRDFFGDDFFGRFQHPDVPQKQNGLGSGVIVDADGVILTNNHVVEGADKIKVRLIDGREFDAKVKGKDPNTDLAVITIEAENLRAVKLGDSDQTKVGEMVLAVGSPLNPNLEHTFTSGIISAKGRSGVGLNKYEDFLQTDAAINQGNSGGALVNLNGELIGINAAIASRTGGFMGIGFAIPVNLASKVMNDLIVDGKVSRGWLGVYIQNINPELAKALNLETTKGVIINKIEEDSPAERAGVKEGDVVQKVNGISVDNATSLSTKIATISPGDKVKLSVLREGKQKTLNVVLGELDNKQNIIADGKADYSNLGLTVSDITNDLARKYRLRGIENGVIVTEIEPGSAADETGLAEGDVIIRLNRKKIRNLQEFNDIAAQFTKGDNVLILIRRGNANLYSAFTIPDNFNK